MSKAQHIIVLTNYNLWYYEVSGKSVARRLQLELPVSDLASLDKFFSVRKPPTVKVLINIYEEEFVFSDIPHVNSVDRKRIISRKLDQHFKSSDLRRSFFQGRRKDGRKDDELMLSAVRDAEVLDQLLDYLYLRKVPISGVYSTQSMIRNYLQPIIANRDVLVMTEIDNGNPQRVAVRQSFYKDGHLKLSRVANIYVANEQTLKDDIQEELNSSRLYLLREHYIGDRDALPVVFIHSTDYLSELSRKPNCMGDRFVLEHVSTVDLGEILGVKVDNDNVKFEDVSAAGASRLVLGAYSSEKTRFYHKHRLLNESLKYGAVAAALMFACLSLYLIFITNNINQESQLLAESTENLHRQTVERRETVNTLDEDINQIQVAVDLVDRVEKENLNVESMFLEIGEAFNQYSKLSIFELDWRQNQDRAIAASGSTEHSTDYDDEYDEEYDEYGDDYGDNVEEESTAQLQYITLRADPQKYGSNLRKMMEDIEGLVGALESSDHIVEVKIVKYPLNLDQEHMLRGRFANDEYQSFSADSTFDMELIIDNAAG